MVSALAWFVLRRAGAFYGTAFLGALLFAVHPLHTEAVANIAGRGELLAAAGVLGARMLRPASTDADLQVFEVQRGAALARVARDLEDTGLVRSALATEWLARLRGVSGSLQAGEYELSASWSTGAILDKISAGRIRTHALVVPEGLRATEIAERLEGAGLAQAAPAMPEGGTGPQPKMRMGSSKQLSPLLASATRRGVRMSYSPRSAPNAAIMTSVAGPPSRRMRR